MAINFRDTTSNQSFNDTDNLSFIYGNFSSLSIPEIKVINIDGRGLIEQQVSKTEKTGADGAFYDNSRIPSRVITVELRIDSNNIRPVLSNLLAGLINQGIKDLKFSDVEGQKYEAIYESHTSPKEDSNSGFFNITFRVISPFALSDTILSTNNTNLITGNLPARVSSYEFTVTENVSNLYIANSSTGNRIDLYYDFITNDNIKIRYEQGNVNVYVNNVGRPEIMSLNSNYEEMQSVKRGDKFTYSIQVGSFQIKYYNRWA